MFKYGYSWKQTIIMTISDIVYSAKQNAYVIHTPKQVAVTLMKRGIDGEEAGVADIYDGLLERFGANYDGMPLSPERQNAIRVVRRWLEGVKYEGLDSPYEASEIKPEALSYVHRMRIVKRHVLNDRALTLREAMIAERLLLEFGDPHGNDVDLIAQFAVVYELAEREIFGDRSDDIEDLLAFAPWRSPKASTLYRTAYEKGLIDSYAIVRIFSPVATSEEMLELITKSLVATRRLDRSLNLPIGGHAQLGLPYFISWRGDKKHFHVDRNVELLKQIHKDPTDIELCKIGCNWSTEVGRDKKAVGQYMSNKPIIDQREELRNEENSDD